MVAFGEFEDGRSDSHRGSEGRDGRMSQSFMIYNKFTTLYKKNYNDMD